MAKKTPAKKTASKKTVKKKATNNASIGSGDLKAPSLPNAKASAIIGDVENLMEMMVTHDVTEIDIEDGPRKIVLKRGCFTPPAQAAGSPPQAVQQAPAAVPASPADAPPAEETSDLIEITSPMVGTFFAASSPDTGPFVTNGANVTDNTVVCIVEAMKVMNEIRAECSGAIVEICVKNAEPVEFGQVIFRVKPL